MAIVGAASAIFSISVFALYPVEVRATGFSLGHNLASMIGGFAPLMISAVQAVLPSTTGLDSVYSVALVLGAGAVFSLFGCLLVAWLKPEANYTRDIYQTKVAASKGMELTASTSDASQMALSLVGGAHEAQHEKKCQSSGVAWELNSGTADSEDRSSSCRSTPV
jgi:hypothetical protein